MLNIITNRLTMKQKANIILFLLMNTAFINPANLEAQCTNCRGTVSIPGMASSAIGINSKASGLAAFASGYQAIASGRKSTGIGSMIHADGANAMIFGSNAICLGDRSMIIGHGYGRLSQDRLTNNIENSLLVGFNSIYPTLFISKSPSKLRTGKVGIGNVTNPQAKLHIRTDNGEVAGLYIEQPNFRVSDFYLGNKEHGIRCTDDHGMIFLTQNDYIFNEGSIGIGTFYPSYNLDVQGSIFSKQFTLFDKDLYLESIEGWILQADAKGNASWTDPSIFDDDDWVFNGNNIYRIEGSVGIGTNYTYGYKLAVNGAIITEEVTVKISENWPDYVFDSDYTLLSIPELESYIAQNRHLPEIPSAGTILKDGLNVGMMEQLLLKKIEELTLYIIRQDAKIEELETKVDLFIHLEEFK